MGGRVLGSIRWKLFGAPKRKYKQNDIEFGKRNLVMANKLLIPAIPAILVFCFIYRDRRPEQLFLLQLDLQILENNIKIINNQLSIIENEINLNIKKSCEIAFGKQIWQWLNIKTLYEQNQTCIGLPKPINYC